MIEGVTSVDNLEMDREVETAPATAVIKICEWCGKSFVSKGRNRSRARVCRREHHRICPICGKDFIISGHDATYVQKACSKKCADKLKIQKTKSAMLEKYGVENASQYPEFQKKMKASLAAQRDEIKMKRDKTMMERYGCLYPMQNDELKAKIQKTNEERYGVKNPVYNEGIRMKISERLKSPEVHEKYLQTSLKN